MLIALAVRSHFPISSTRGSRAVDDLWQKSGQAQTLAAMLR